MEPPQLSEIEVQDIDHLGLIAGIIDAIGMEEIVNKCLGQHPQEEVSAGVVVKALILNCFGFLSGPLYLFSQFFEGKAIEHLLGEGIQAEHLNDSRIGRVLDQLYTYGLSRLFARIALKASQVFEVDCSRTHIDGSSFSVQGAYENKESEAPSTIPVEDNAFAAPQDTAQQEDSAQPNSDEDTPVPILITHGYSRDKRSDLKQFTTALISSSDHDVPLYFQVGNGNDSESKVFPEVIKEYQEQWSADELEVVTADAALYSDANLQSLGTTPWIIRVPATLASAQWLLENLQTEQFQPSEREGYRFSEVGSYYGGITQRWLIVESQARQRADLKSLDKGISRLTREKTKALKALFLTDFACESDATSALSVFEKTLKYHRLVDIAVVQTAHYASKGRPPKGAKPSHYTYHPTAQLERNNEAITIAQTKAGRFIIATNRLQLESLDVLDASEPDVIASPPGYEPAASQQVLSFNEQQWSQDELLSEYKNQQACERGFRFLKDPLFFVSRVFLKKTQRVAALAMVMGLCLLVYSLGQRQLRQALEQTQQTIPNQKGKPTKRPTFRWILQCFHTVHLMWLNGTKGGIKLSTLQRHILSFFDLHCQRYYLVNASTC